MILVIGVLDLSKNLNKRYSFEYINNITDAQMKKLVSIYTIIRRDYEIEADTDKQAVNLAYKNLSDYDDETREEKVMVDGVDFYECNMTDAQEKIVKDIVDAKMQSIITDSVDRNNFVDSIIDSVIDDINETADWSEMTDDEVCVGDIDIALARVLLNLVEKNRET